MEGLFTRRLISSLRSRSASLSSSASTLLTSLPACAPVQQRAPAALHPAQSPALTKHDQPLGSAAQLQRSSQPRSLALRRLQLTMLPAAAPSIRTQNPTPATLPTSPYFPLRTCLTVIVRLCRLLWLDAQLSSKVTLAPRAQRPSPLAVVLRLLAQVALVLHCTTPRRLGHAQFRRAPNPRGARGQLRQEHTAQQSPGFASSQPNAA